MTIDVGGVVLFQTTGSNHRTMISVLAIACSMNIPTLYKYLQGQSLSPWCVETIGNGRQNKRYLKVTSHCTFDDPVPQNR